MRDKTKRAQEGQVRSWKRPVIALVAFLVIAIVYFWLFLADDFRSSGDQPDSGIAKSEAQYAASRQLFAVTEVNIRDRPTTEDSVILGKLPRGSAVTGTLKMGMDGTSSWFELADGKGYIADINLSETQPPTIAKELGNKIWITDQATDIWTQPDPAGGLLDRVKAGTSLTLFGLTANNYVEVKISKGGVGYLADGAGILARLGGKPMTISFNPQSCSFGNELDAEFAKIGARLRAQWTELESREFADEAARDKAYASVEGKSTYVKLQRSFEGLSITAIAQHYEAQSVYFADPPAKVIDVFRRKGFAIGRDGTLPSTDLYAAITPTRGEGAAYGKTDLGCGV
ncbi:hypothetical protein [Sphingorhabdus sp.]|uniref:hypothetical protein n=1 Tax=Sphingorhabdus sp. TaxID=1902408 RepID=UPI003592EA6A